jgi:hypothetical protein
MSQELDETAEAERQIAVTEAKSNKFQAEFDKLLFSFLIVGFLLTLVYGASAGTCPPDPQQLARLAAPAAQQGQARAPRTVSPRSAGAGSAGNAQSPAADANLTEGNATAPEQGTASNSVTANQTAPNGAAGGQSAGQSVSSVRRAPCADGGSGLVGALLALAIALAALAIGVFVGFLFGLPRTLTSSEVRAARRQAASQHPPEGGGSTDAAGGGSGGSGSDVNTNLEKISDWLTTIIVGVGLTKLQDIPGALESFGENVALYFGYGGKVFGIAGGLFFLIAGFFLAYVGTRVKLSLVFVWSQRTNQGAATPQISAQAVQTSSAAPPVPIAGSPAEGDEKVKEADRQLLSKTLSDLKSPDEIVAWANAKARAGDFASALAAYKDVLTQVPPTEALQTNYATVLAAAGDTIAANNVVANMTTTGLSPDAQREARQRIAAAAQAGKAAELRARLQQGLYKPPQERAFEDSIAAGEDLLKLGDPGDPWVYVWLASAYGQRHAALAAKPERSPEEQAQLEAAAARAVELVEQALAIEPKLKPTLQGLYDPAHRVGDDDDLNSLRPNAKLDILLLDKPAETPAMDPEARVAPESDAVDPKAAT